MSLGRVNEKLIQGDNVNLGTSHRMTSILGVMTILFWASHLLYLPPFHSKPDIKGLSKDVFQAREFSPKKYESQQEIENDLNESLSALYHRAYLLILAGILSGVLLLVRNKHGILLAIAMALLMLATRIIGMFGYHRGVLAWFKVVYGYLLFVMPIQVIHKDILGPILFIFSLVFLLGRYMSMLSIKNHQSFEQSDPHSL